MIVPVQLELSWDHISFFFKDDSLEMFCTEKLLIENKGNGSAKWKLVSIDPNIF